MSAKAKPLQTKFAKETRFKISPVFGGPFRGPVESRIEQLKHKLLFPALRDVTDAQLRSELRWAAQEAASLAWTMPFPLLILPELIQEKMAQARKRWENQQRIWREGCLALAA